jgi:signal transduction histidine kinase
MKYLIETNELEQTLDLMITPMMLTNEAGTPVYLNRAFQFQVGYIIKELPDMDSWFEKAYPNSYYRKKIMESWDDAWASALTSGDASMHVTSKICCADGTYKWFDVHRHTIGNKHAITFLNVDELKQHNEDLATIVHQKETLISIIAHDVRSPLSSIKQIVDGYENLNLSEWDVEDLFNRMSNQVDHVFNILNSLLMRTGNERGMFAEQQEPIDLNSFFSKYLGYYKERLKYQKVNLVLDLPEGGILNYDPGILDVICRNLLDNAIKYTAENGVICISFTKIAGHGKILIRDTGPGMSREQVDRIINNEGGHKMHKQITDGFGLGLMLAKEILERYHGKLSVKSEIGIGTSFIIDITDDSLN